MPEPLFLAVRLAARELRGGLAGFRILLACLTLGVFAIAAVGSVSSAMRQSLEAHAREILGGDLEFRMAQRPMPHETEVWLAQHGRVSQVRLLRAMLRREDGSARTLTELKAVDQAYPLVGSVTLEPAIALADALAIKDGIPGIALDPALATRLDAKVGDVVALGDIKARVTAILMSMPDSANGVFALGPPSLVSRDTLTLAGLDRPGTLSSSATRVVLPDDIDPAVILRLANATFPKIGWTSRDRSHASQTLDAFVARTAEFLELTGLAALAVGGLGVANAVAAYLSAKETVIATLKCLGASSRLVTRIYLIQVLALSAAGIAIGLVLGAAMPPVVGALFGDLLPVPLSPGPFLLPLALAAWFGLLTAAGFALWPLARARSLSPALLFRRGAVSGSGKITVTDALAPTLLLTLLAASAVLGATERLKALWFVGGLLAALAVFRGVGSLIRLTARGTSSRIPAAWGRHAVANLHRPGAATVAVALSLGVGLTLLVAVGAVESTIEDSLGDAVATRAPSLFFIDIQPDQRAPFDALVRGTDGTSDLRVEPSLRTRVTALNGVPIDMAPVDPAQRPLISGERGLSYAARLPEGSVVTEGRWWPADYSGPPLISLDDGMAHGMRLKPGDTMTFDVVGRPITATVANLRHINWSNFGINYFMLLAPGTLEAAPQTMIASVRVPPGSAEAALTTAVTDRFPNISAIPVREAIATARRVLASFADVIRAVSVLSLATGILVLAGAVAAGNQRRLGDAVIMKVLGATRWTILRGLLVEFATVGAVVSLAAALLGTLAGDAILTFVMDQTPGSTWGVATATVAGGTLLVLAVALGNAWRFLSVSPARYLREE